MEKRYTFEELTEIIAALRGEPGCPWDKKQTHHSLRTCMIEEAYEVIEGIRLLEETGSAENLCEELGDVLLQVLLHSQIAKEESYFTLEDVIQGISEKMIRRHPHVFGEGKVDGAEAVVANWDEIKKKEKKRSDVPQSFPALIRAGKVLKKFEHDKQMFASETDSILQAKELLERLEQGEEAPEIIGKLLLEISNISRKRKIHAEQALADEVEKIILQNP